MFRIPHPLKLEGRLVKLEPLTEAHFPELLAIADAAEIWAHMPLAGTQPDRLKTALRNALLHRSAGTQYPFAIIEKSTGALIGSTRFMDVFPEHQKLEIGWTWYTPRVWGKGHNLDCKLTLLGCCFERLALNRVQLKTRDTNKRSQAAILKLGAQYEGTLRADRVMPDGQVRDTCVFSFIKEEWPAAKEVLLQKLNAFL